MPTPALSRELAEDAIARVEQKLREGCVPQGQGGGKSAVRAAGEQAVADGWCATAHTFEGRLLAAKERHQLAPDWTLYRPNRYQQPTPSFVLQPAIAHVPQELSGRAERVLAIGDLHQDPRHEHRLEVLTWIARYASEQRFDRIIQVGDWSTWDSVNQHDKNDTFAARYKPGIRADMDNLIASHRAFRNGLAADYKPRLMMLMGNHEYRLERFENANPEAQGTYTLERDQIFAQFGWKTRPYGEIFYVEGVGFTHHATNAAGRAYGGKTGAQRAANDTTIALVGGHTHKRQLHDSPKIGPVGVVTVTEIGCAMPWGEVETYTKIAPTGWWYGIVPMTVQDGAITDIDFVSMISLRSKYAEREAAVPRAAQTLAPSLG